MKQERKFTHIKSVSGIEVLGEHGYIPVKTIMKTIPYDVYIVKLENGLHVECADNHIFIDKDDTNVFAIESIGRYIKTENGVSKVIEIEKTDRCESMYDLQLEHTHIYYSNGVLSHNTTVVAGYLCHQMIFNKDYTIAILANKGITAREVLGRVQLMYEELPWFLQMGISVWNKGDIKLGNGSKVLSAATSGSSIRGKSINCIDETLEVTVKNKATGLIEKLSIKDLKGRLNQ